MNSNLGNKTNLSENLKYCEIKEVFQTFDKDNDGYITIKELGTIMRALGQNPSEQDIQDINKIYDRDETGKIEFNDFFHLVQQRMKDPPLEEEMIEAFKLSDKENYGIITADEIAHAMSNAGEKLSKEEIDDLLRAMDPKAEGQVNYEEFVRMMMSK